MEGHENSDIDAQTSAKVFTDDTAMLPSEIDTNVADKRKSSGVKRKITGKQKATEKETTELQREFLKIVDDMRIAGVNFPKEFQTWFTIRERTGQLGGCINVKTFLTREAAQEDCANEYEDFEVGDSINSDEKYDSLHTSVVFGGNCGKFGEKYGQHEDSNNRGCDVDYQLQCDVDVRFAVTTTTTKAFKKCFLFA